MCCIAMCTISNQMPVFYEPRMEREPGRFFFYMQVFLHYHTYCNLINIRPLMLSFADMLRRGRSETISVCLGYDLNHQLNNMKTSLGE